MTFSNCTVPNVSLHRTMTGILQQMRCLMNYFDSDMSNSTNTLVHFDEKTGTLYLLLRARSQTIYAAQVSCPIVHPAKVEQTITRQHGLLRRESLIDGVFVTIILCLHIFIAHHIFINFWIC